MTKNFKTKIINSLLITAVSISVSLIILFLVDGSENVYYDLLFKKIRKYEVTDDPVIIAIDQNSLNKFNHVLWPWPRSIYGTVVNYLNQCDVSVISFDILFTTPGVDRINSGKGTTSDSVFAMSMKEAKNTTLAIQFEDNSLIQSDRLYEGYLEKSSSVPNAFFHNFTKASLPIKVFQKNTEYLGAVNIPTTSSGIIRKLPLLFEYNGKIIPHLSLSTYMLHKGIKDYSYDEKINSIVVGDLKIPVDKNGDYLINWYGEGGVNSSFKYYSFANLLTSAMAYEFGEKPIISPKELRGKSIFIGAVASGLLDMKSTPVSSDSPYPGIEIYTTMFKNFQNRDFVHHFPIVLWLVILFVFFTLNAGIWKSDRFSLATFTSLILIIIPIILSILLFRFSSILFPIIAFESGLLLNLVLSIMIEYFWAGKRNRKLRKNFSRYLEPRLVKIIADSPEYIETSGDEVVATVLFSDIKNFTKISDTMNSKRVVNFLNNYFEKGEKLIFKNHGMLDKYTGDGLMALFGVPVPDKNHAISACNAIIDFNHVQNIKIEGENSINIQTRIGVHTGPLVAGNIGSSRRVDYTAIGSTVNIAARLEQVNKNFNTSNIISANTCDLVNRHFVCRDLDYYKVRGIKDPLHIYTVLCKKDDINNEIDTLLALHENALELFRNKNYMQAMQEFQELKEQFPRDKIADYFIKKCQRRIK